MALARFHGFAAVPSGSSFVIAPSAVVTVRREDTGALASLFSDRDGLVGIANPLTADSAGRFAFHAAALIDGYRITVTEAASPGTEYTFRYVPMGTFAEYSKPSGTDGYPLIHLDAATNDLVHLPPGLGFNLVGGYLDWTVVGSPTSTLAVSIKTWSGNDPSSTEPVFVAFRSATAGTGSLTYRKISQATSVVINSSALLGTVSNIPFRLWCVAFDDSGTIRLALINCLSTSAGAGSGRDVTAIYPLGGWGIASATQESDTADSAQTFYSDGAAVSSKAYATLGFGTWESGLANAGNWNSNPTRIQLFGPGVPLPGQVVQVQRSSSGAVATGTTLFPLDDTIPQITEGDQYMSQAITPSSAANVLLNEHRGNYAAGGADQVFLAALFQDAVSNALASTRHNVVSNLRLQLSLQYMMLAATTSSTTMRIRAGGNQAATTTFNGQGGAREFGGSLASHLTVTELMG